MAYEKKRKHPKKESAFIRDFMKEFDFDPNCWYFKSHGEPMQVRGIPDIIMCYGGLFLGLEFKIRRSGVLKVTPYQQYTIDKINKSKGLSFVVFFDEKNAKVGIGTQLFTNTKEASRHLKKALIEYVELMDSWKAKNKESNVKESGANKG